MTYLVVLLCDEGYEAEPRFELKVFAPASGTVKLVSLLVF